MIPFNKPSLTDVEKSFMRTAVESGKICGDGQFTKKVYDIFKDTTGVTNMLLTTSGTHSLDMAAILADLKPGDEVIASSYTFVSTVNAFMLRGAIPVFVDIEPQTLNLDTNLIEEKITSKTKAIFLTHYAGVCCDMDKIMSIAKRHNLIVVEDAAQAVGSTYKGLPAGTIGDMGCYSFHETKNYSMGEGGAVIVKDNDLFKRAEIIREKGTDRSQFIRGIIDKYTWQDIGSSFLPSDILAAMLYGQMTRFEEIMSKRMAVWNTYNTVLAKGEKDGLLTRTVIPNYATHNAHLYYVLLNSEEERNRAISKMKDKGISCVFHYIPLHTSPMGRKLGYKQGDLPITESCASRLMRLPLYADLSTDEATTIANTLLSVL